MTSDDNLPAALILAIRNKAILRWLESQDLPRLNILVMSYASELRCPTCEICRDFQEPEDLAFLWRTCQREIEEFNRGGAALL